jgi:uncharacterized protein (TIGR01777 family)
MRIILPGGSGQIGQILARHLHSCGHQVTVLSRTPDHSTPWQTLDWTDLPHILNGSDAVIHLSGRSVNCRYTPANRKDILDSRIEPTLRIGHAIQHCDRPPAVWMNASTSTFYAHTLEEPQDEFSKELGGAQPELPSSWRFSVDVARRWEEAFYTHPTPHTRKIALRTSMTMSPDPGGVFSVLVGLAKVGLGGTQGPGTQYVSWIHDLDYTRAIDFLLQHPEIHGPVNFTAPNPLPNRDFQRILRQAWGMPLGLPAATWMLELGAVFLRTETELILKSRRAVPTVLSQHGFQFDFPDWRHAAEDLVTRYKLLRANDDG